MLAAAILTLQAPGLQLFFSARVTWL